MEVTLLTDVGRDLAKIKLILPAEIEEVNISEDKIIIRVPNNDSLAEIFDNIEQNKSNFGIVGMNVSAFKLDDLYTK